MQLMWDSAAVAEPAVSAEPFCSHWKWQVCLSTFYYWQDWKCGEEILPIIRSTLKFIYTKQHKHLFDILWSLTLGTTLSMSIDDISSSVQYLIGGNLEETNITLFSERWWIICMTSRRGLYIFKFEYKTREGHFIRWGEVGVAHSWI